MAYKNVRELVPKLWDGRKIDYAVHIGMAGGRRYYSVERRGHRDGYGAADVGHEFLGDADRQKAEGTDWIWNGLPEEILSDMNIDDVWVRWRAAMPDTDVRISEDAGRYLCDFIYFSSLGHLTKKDERRRVSFQILMWMDLLLTCDQVVFLHVPVDVNESAIRVGVEATLELIRAVIQSDRRSKPKSGTSGPTDLQHVAQEPLGQPTQ